MLKYPFPLSFEASCFFRTEPCVRYDTLSHVVHIFLLCSRCFLLSKIRTIPMRPVKMFIFVARQSFICCLLLVLCSSPVGQQGTWTQKSCKTLGSCNAQVSEFISTMELWKCTDIDRLLLLSPVLIDQPLLSDQHFSLN